MRKLIFILLVLAFTPAMGALSPPSHPVLIPIKLPVCSASDNWEQMLRNGCFSFWVRSVFGGK